MATSSDFSRSYFRGSDEVKVILCEPCEQAGSQIEAEGFCVDCSEYLCGQCFKKHKLFKAFRSHVLQGKDSMPQSLTEVRIKDVCVSNCDLHSDKVIEYYCSSCDELGCATCITLDHRQCTKVEHIPNIVKSSDVDGDIQQFIKKVDILSQHAKESTRALQSQTNAEDMIRKEAEATLKKERAELNKYFDDLERKMEYKINEIHTNNTTTLTSNSKAYDTISTNLSEIKTEVSKKQYGGHKCETFISMKKSTSYIDAAEKESEVMQKESKIVQYKFLPSHLIKTLMEQIDEIGNLETKTVAILNAKLVPIRKSSFKKERTYKEATYLSDVSNMKPKSSKSFSALRLTDDISVRTSNDKNKPLVTGIVMVQEHFIVVSDRHNKAVKVLDIRSKEVISELKIETDIWRVTKVCEDTVAIGSTNYIHLLSVSPHGLLSKKQVIHSNQVCMGAEYSKGRLIMACVFSITIIDMQGNELKEIKTDSEGNELFENCVDVAISGDHDLIYVSDYKKNTVTCMTLGGNVKVIYRDTDLKGPLGIALDKAGFVYVCCTGTESILQLSADCTKLHVFNQITGGLCIICTNTNKLIFGFLDRVILNDLV